MKARHGDRYMDVAYQSNALGQVARRQNNAGAIIEEQLPSGNLNKEKLYVTYRGNTIRKYRGDIKSVALSHTPQGGTEVHATATYRTYPTREYRGPVHKKAPS